jgi:hypothetical protein
MQTSTMVALLLSATSLNQQTGDQLTSEIKHHGCSTLYDSHSRKHDALSKGRKVRRADLNANLNNGSPTIIRNIPQSANWRPADQRDKASWLLNSL